MGEFQANFEGLQTFFPGRNPQVDHCEYLLDEARNIMCCHTALHCLVRSVDHSLWRVTEGMGFLKVFEWVGESRITDLSLVPLSK